MTHRSPRPAGLRPVAVAAAALALLCAMTARAGDIPDTPADFKRLPPYCAARLHKAGPAAEERWNRIIGPNFIHIHHYCFALHKRWLALQEFDPTARRNMLNSAIREIDYVETHASGTIPFYAEIYTQRGKLHLLLDQQAEAVSYFRRAVAEDPNYGPAYAALAQLFIKQGHPDQARKVVSEGMKAAPGSPALRKLQARLGMPTAQADAGGGKTKATTDSKTDGASGVTAAEEAAP
jgi:tetratricopeptide (TPR) repeat protein